MSFFWACFDCGANIRGDQQKITKESSAHVCSKNEFERECIASIMKVLQNYAADLPPSSAPPPPPKPKLLNQPMTKKEKIDKILNQSWKEDPRIVMPVNLMDELKDAFK